MSYLIATAVGGTCTDTVVLAPNGRIHIGKALSTPPDFANGVLASIASAAGPMGLSLGELLAGCHLFVHGSTVADNTVLTRDGARTGLVTTRGFEDTLLVTRGAFGRWAGLPEERVKHPVKTDRAEPLVPRARIAGVPERVDCDGDVILALDEEAVEAAVRRLVEDEGVSALAVSLLWSFLNPEHERRVRAIASTVAPGLYVSLSSEISPVPGEYERTSTAVINAYSGRVVHDYLNNLSRLLAGNGYCGAIMVTQGYGGLLPAAEAADRAVGMIECGPAAGVIGARFLGELMGETDIIAADMGGTTFKIGVIQRGEIEYAREPMVDRFHYLAPKIEVVSIGSGGGSIVSVDGRTGLPRVGPRSAGADPGPVCYGRGGAEPTLTDVLLLIGYMDPGQFLGGTMTLDRAAAASVFEETVARPLGLPVTEAAIGIYRVACAQIADLVREITVERGLDPRDFALHAFGGTCGTLAGVFGQELSVRQVVIPYTAAVHCAFGLVTADVSHEYAVTTTLPADTASATVNALFAPMEERARAQLAAEGITGERVAMEWSVDLRYTRQVHEVTTKVAAARPLDGAGLARLVDDFEALYQRKFGRGSAYREAGIEMTMFRLTARGLMPRPDVPTEQEGDADAAGAVIGTRTIYAGETAGMTGGTILDFTKLSPGNVVDGPAIIHTPLTTIALHAGHRARMDRWRNIVVTFPR